MNGKLWIVIALALVSASADFADSTFVQPGFVSGNWTADHSPYVIQGDVHVPAGESLNIGAGVRVYFNGLFRLEVDSLADFSANGAEADSVVFTTDTVAHPLRWCGILIHCPTDTVRMSYVVIEDTRRDSTRMEGSTPDTIAFQNALEIRYGPGLELTHSSFRRNLASGYGGALFDGVQYSHIAYCRFSDGFGEFGGAIYMYGNSEITDCVFERNRSYGGGGAVHLVGNNSSVARCIFRQNLADGGEDGGGAIEHLNGVLSLSDCLFLGDSVWGGPGGAVNSGIWGEDAATTLVATRCLFVDNMAFRAGGAVCIQNGSLINCTIVGTYSLDGWAAINAGNWSHHDTVKVINSIVTDTRNGSAIHLNGAGDEIQYCLLHGNGAAQIYRDSLVGRITHTNANGDSCGAYQNLFLDPMFVDPAAGDYHLTANSPCIDAGDPSTPRDPDGTIADIGAFYYNQLGARDQFTSRPSTYTLSAAPNPFNAVTRISFSLPRAGDVNLSVYDITGRLAATLANGNLDAGVHEFPFDGKSLASGIYFVRLIGKDVSQTRKIELIR